MKPVELISLVFLLFGGIVLVVHWLLPQRARNAWLLLASMAFYATWGGGYFLALAAVIVWNLFAARRIFRSGKKAWLWAGIGVDLLIFASLKFLSSMYGYSLIRLFTDDQAVTDLEAALLPVGFSFYILQAISYLVGASRKRMAEPGLLEAALYLAYFPKILAGPIEKPWELLPQLQAERRLDRRRLGEGAGLILTGLVRKLVIANLLVLLRPEGMASAPQSFSLLERIIWLVVFAIILYNDFAGYSALAQGISLLFGIQLTRNFRPPFFAHSFSDFWQRWHISLSEWLRENIFFPVQRSLLRFGWDRRLVTVLSPLLTMLVSGLWHGVSLGMLGWGALHGAFIALEQFTRRGKPQGRTSHILLVGATFVFTTLAWIPFSSSKLQTALHFFASPLALPPLQFPWILLLDLLLLGALSLWIDVQEEKYSSLFFMAWTPRVQAWGIALALLLILVSSRAPVDLSGFVYQGF